MTPRRRSALCAFIILLVAATAGATRPEASEPLGDLNLALKLVEAPLGRGVARIEVTLDARRESEDVVLRVVRPDGRELRTAGRPDWTDLRGRLLGREDRGIVVPARGAIRTWIDVPLDGAGTQQIVVRAVAMAESGAVSTEATLRVPLEGGAGLDERDGFANFAVGEAQ